MGIDNTPSLTLLLSFVFFILYVSAAEQSVCSRLEFGYPDFHACNTLLFGGTARFPRGINLIDGLDHAFLLWQFAKESDFTRQQWENRVYIPHIFAIRK